MPTFYSSYIILKNNTVARPWDGRLRRHPRNFALPKAFSTQICDLCCAFLTLIRSIKRACFAASH